MEPIKILLAEDDPNLGMLLSKFIRAKGYKCTLSVDGKEAYKAFTSDTFDFVILDVMMPKKDGFAVAKDIRGIDKEIPILFLTAKSMKEDKLKGFEIGADDYLTKPFSMDELMARVNAILKRTNKQEENHLYSIHNYLFDFNTRILSFQGNEQKLTTKESELFKILCKNIGKEVDRNDMLKAVWGDDNYFNGRSMDVYITKLRKYLNQDDNVEIVNIHGKGFKLMTK
ncbi:response regulator transcription factor [Flavobacteriales bacterium]|nr:response regulator transcription factor [Flavobacteriales bacterium]